MAQEEHITAVVARLCTTSDGRVFSQWVHSEYLKAVASMLTARGEELVALQQRAVSFSTIDRMFQNATGHQ